MSYCNIILIYFLSRYSNEGTLPYTLGNSNSVNPRSTETVSTKLTDEIPFQISPAYNYFLTSHSSAPKHTSGLRQIDWDSLNYDFTLEKSIVQS